MYTNDLVECISQPAADIALLFTRKNLVTQQDLLMHPDEAMEVNNTHVVCSVYQCFS